MRGYIDDALFAQLLDEADKRVAVNWWLIGFWQALEREKAPVRQAVRGD